jgi:lipopolysaccharide assembly protein B
MEFTLAWFIVPIAVAFALGWLLARLDRWQINREPKEAPRAYFKGLTHLLNEQQDKAIDSFVEAVKLDPQTVELQFALGNLFRRRGEYERSVRVHQSLAERGDLGALERERARFELAGDYMKAGLLDRAEQAYKPLADNAQGKYTTEALQALLSVAERSKDWPAAIKAAQGLEARGAGSYARWVAQYWCELAEQYWTRNGTNSGANNGTNIGTAAQPHDAALIDKAAKAREALLEALKANKACVRAVLLQGDIAERLGDPGGAWASWRSLESLAPDYLPLAALRVGKLAVESGSDAALAKTVVPTLERWKDMSGNVDVMDALLAWTPQPAARSALADSFLQHTKTLSAAQRALKHHPGMAEMQAELISAVDQALKTRHRFRCASCGFEARQYFWQCPGCVGWETYPPRRMEE